MTRETNTTEQLPVAPIEMDERLLTALQAISDKKGTDLVVLNIGKVASFTEYFIICSGSSSRQTKAIADEVADKLRDRKTRPTHIEGEKTGEWILLDYGDFIVHIFTESARLFYDLERLWRDAEVVPIPAELK